MDGLNSRGNLRNPAIWTNSFIPWNSVRLLWKESRCTHNNRRGNSLLKTLLPLESGDEGQKDSCHPRLKIWRRHQTSPFLQPHSSCSLQNKHSCFLSPFLFFSGTDVGYEEQHFFFCFPFGNMFFCVSLCSQYSVFLFSFFHYCLCFLFPGNVYTSPQKAMCILRESVWLCVSLQPYLCHCSSWRFITVKNKGFTLEKQPVKSILAHTHWSSRPYCIYVSVL